MPAGDVKQAPQMAEIQGAPPVEQVAAEEFRSALEASFSIERGSAPNRLTVDNAKAKFSDVTAGDSAVRGRVEVSSTELGKAVAKGSEVHASARLAVAIKTSAAATVPRGPETFAVTPSRLAATTSGTVKATATLATTAMSSTATVVVEQDSAAPVSAGKLASVDLDAAGANLQRRRAEVAAAPQQTDAENLPSVRNAAPSQQKATGGAGTHDEKRVQKADVIVSAVVSVTVQTVAKPEAAGGLQPVKPAEPVSVSLPVQTLVGVSGSDGAVKSSPALEILPGTPVGNPALEAKSSVASIVRGDLQAIPSVPAIEVGVNRTPVNATANETAQPNHAVSSPVADVDALRGPLLPHFEEVASVTVDATVNPAAALTQTSKEVVPKPISMPKAISPSPVVSPSSDSKFNHSLVQVPADLSGVAVGPGESTQTGKDVTAHGLKSVAMETPEVFAPASVLQASASAMTTAEVAEAGAVIHERATSDPVAASVTTPTDAKRARADSKSSEPAMGPVSSQRSAAALVTPSNAASYAVSDDAAGGNKELSSPVRVEAPLGVAASSHPGSSAIVTATNASASNPAFAASTTVPADVHRELVGGGSPAETNVAGLAMRLGTSGVSDIVISSDAHRTLIATPTTLEVGVSDGGQGWLKIRAEVGGDGGVTASLAAASSGGQEMLKGQLPALNEYLHNEHMMVTTTVAERSFVTSASGLAGLATGADGSGGSHSPGSSHGYNGQGQMDGGLSQGGDQRKAGGEFASDPERRYDRGAGIAGAELVSGVSAMMNAQFAAPEENGYRLNVRV